jgi:hypothetical protein
MKVTYNERSWAIDLISEINNYLSLRDRKIKRAGGEMTVSTETENLFPDVLLFGEKSIASIIQGWELKFPDTSITDINLIENACKKAQYLGLNSFLLWNVTTAVLYISNNLKDYEPVKTWDDLNYITRRDEVESNRNQWINLVHNIIDDLNDFFDSGQIASSTIINALDDNNIYEIILFNMDTVAEKIKQKASTDSTLDAHIEIWWRTISHEYPMENESTLVLARINLVSWINKIVFAHILRRFFSFASTVENIDEYTTPDEAQKIFETISNRCNFWNIFSSSLGETVLSDQAWLHLVQLNKFLSEVHFQDIDQTILHELLQKTVVASKRKVAGQYATPYPLAELLIRLTMDDKSLTFYDPFCGTGTIPKAAYDIKIEYGQSSTNALANIWASDKFSFPLKIAMLALSEPQNLGEILHVFQKDVIDLNTGLEIEFQDPYSGSVVKKDLPLFDYIASNLPFVQFEDLDELNPKILNINQLITKEIGEEFVLSGKSDLCAYLPFYLWSLLLETGKLGIIISNAWLGTDWGEKFQEALRRFFIIKKIITSGVGRWFHNADVVTNMVILEKKPVISEPKSNEKTSFIIIEKPLQQIESENSTKSIASLAITETSSPNEIEVKTYTANEIIELRKLGLGFNALFADVRWIKDIQDKLIPVNNLFKFYRGERRGWNAMFYPASGHGIEQQYIRPVLKSPKSVTGLIACPDREAFCCSKTIEELHKLKHSGALSWIKKFEKTTNKTGIPLPRVLKRANMHWYEMNDTTMAELVALISYDKRLYIAKALQPTFVDQRLISLTLINKTVDINLCHALMNSSLGLFYIEALGFGRGLGALDLSSTKLEKRLFMLNPRLLSPQQTVKIITAFSPLLKRDVYPIMEELTRTDRITFDKVVFECFGIQSYQDKIYDALKQLYNIRKSVDIS